MLFISFIWVTDLISSSIDRIHPLLLAISSLFWAIHFVVILLLLRTISLPADSSYILCFLILVCLFDLEDLKLFDLSLALLVGGQSLSLAVSWSIFLIGFLSGISYCLGNSSIFFFFSPDPPHFFSFAGEKQSSHPHKVFYTIRLFLLSVKNNHLSKQKGFYPAG